MLYELLAGATPFARQNAPETFAAILRDEPAPLGAAAPEPLARVVARALRKDPAGRHATALELAHDLERAGRAITAESNVATIRIPEVKRAN